MLKYNRWSEWWHLNLLKASEEILSEYTGNGCSLNCVPAARKLSCSCYHWIELMTRGCSPCQNELKIWNPPLLTNPDKTQKPYQKWLTSEKPPLGELCWPPRLCAEAKWGWLKHHLKLHQNTPTGKGWSSAQNLGSISCRNPDPEHLQDGLRPLSQWLRSLYESPAPQQT